MFFKNGVKLLFVLFTAVLVGCSSSSGGSSTDSLGEDEASDNGGFLRATVSGNYRGRGGENVIDFSHEVLISYSFEEDEENPLAPGVAPVSIQNGQLRVLKGACLGLDILDEGATNWSLRVGTSDFSPTLFKHNCIQLLQTEIGQDVALRVDETISFPEDTTITSFGGAHLIGTAFSEDFYFLNGSVTPRD